MTERISKIKKGDTVKIISGKDKGKTGKIIKNLCKTNQLIIENINMATKHVRPQKEGEAGQIIKIEKAIDKSNVVIYTKISKNSNS